MKQQLIDDLLAYLKATPESDERDRLIEELQVIGASLVYKPRTTYRLERHYTSEKTEYVDGKLTLVPHPCMVNLRACPCTANVQKMRANVRVMIETYPLEELRLYYGSRRIRDIAAWLEEEQ